MSQLDKTNEAVSHAVVFSSEISVITAGERGCCGTVEITAREGEKWTLE